MHRSRPYRPLVVGLLLAGSLASPALASGATGGTAYDPTPRASESSSYVFPVRGTHSYGGRASRYGAPRSGHRHQGQDISARAGTRLAAVHAGRIVKRAYQRGGAGHYIVLRGDDRFDYVYMHLRSAASVPQGRRVKRGQTLGRVGCTGSCSGPHLHFEIWRGRWHAGGAPIDPLPTLRRWDAFS